MSAALTGGFDSCLELAGSFLDLEAEPAVAAVLQPLQNQQLPLTPAAGPRALTGTVRLLLSAAHVEPAGDAADGRVTVRIDGTLGLHITAPEQDQLALEAVVSLPGLPLVLSPPATRDATTQSSFAVNLSNFQVTVQARPGGAADLAALAGRLGLAPEVITTTVAQTLQGALAAALAIVTPGTSIFPLAGPTLPTLQFAAPGQNGRIGQTAQGTFLTDVAMATRQETSEHPAVLCVLGDLFDRPAPTGSPQDKTLVATTDGAGTFIVTAGAARRFLLCPAVFRALLPTYLDQVLDSGVLRAIRPSDVPGYAGFDANYQHDIFDALRHGQVGYFFDLVLPGGLPPASYRPALGETIFGQLPARIADLLSDTAAAMDTILPGRCGRADSMPMPDSKLTEITASLITDLISLNGVIEPTAWGVGGQIRFATTFYASVQYPGTVSLTASPPTIDSTIHLEWYAVLIGAIVGAILTALTAISGGATAVAEAAAAGAVAGTVASLAIVQTVLAAFAVNAVTYQLGQILASLAAPVLPLPMGAVPTGISISPEAMTLGFGVAPGTPDNPPLTAPGPTLTLAVQVTSDRRTGDSGILEIDNGCVHGSFPYQDYVITTYASFTATGTNLAAPVTYEWTVDGSPLPDAYGTLFANDPAYNMLYSFAADFTSMTLLNESGSPSYSRLVRCVATGSDGVSAEASLGAFFVGFERDLDPAYSAQLARCIASLIHNLGAFGREPGPAPGYSGSLSGQNLANLIERLIPGGEWDPRAASLIGAILTLTGPEVSEVAGAAAIREALTAAGHIVPAVLEG